MVEEKYDEQQTILDEHQNRTLLWKGVLLVPQHEPHQSDGERTGLMPSELDTTSSGKYPRDPVRLQRHPRGRLHPMPS